MPSSSARWSASLLVLAVLAAYANAFGGSFQFDDYNVIVREGAVHSIGAWWASMPGIRPLLKLSYALSWGAGGGTLAFHAVNVALHAANALLVWAVLQEVWKRAGMREAGFAAFAGALLFALHPANTEAVTYVSGRSTSMMAFFYLASVLTYLREAPRWLSPVLFVAALATKEVAVTLPVVLVLCDAIDTQRPIDPRRQWLHWVVLGAGIALMTALPRYREMLDTSLALRPFGEQLALQAGAIARHVGVLALAVPPNIDPEVSPLTPLPVLAAIAVGFALLRVQPAVAFALLWFLLHLAPTNSILPRIDAVNDRQLYLACIGPLALAGLAIALALRWRAALLLTLTLLLAALTVARNQDYATEVALWSDTVRKSPRSARAFNNLGYALQLEGRRDEARRAYERAVALDPAYEKARINLRLLSPP